MTEVERVMKFSFISHRAQISVTETDPQYPPGPGSVEHLAHPYDRLDSLDSILALDEICCRQVEVKG